MTKLAVKIYRSLYDPTLQEIVSLCEVRLRNSQIDIDRYAIGAFGIIASGGGALYDQRLDPMRTQRLNRADGDDLLTAMLDRVPASLVVVLIS